MAICGHCGAQIRDDIWVCSACGEPVATAQPRTSSDTAAYAAAPAFAAAGSMSGAGEQTTAYGTPAPELPSAAKPAGARSSGLVWIVAIGGVVAVVAIVMVWLFVLRGGGGDPAPYLGSWQMSLPTGSIQSSGPTAMTMTITPQGGGAELTLAVSGQTMGPYKTTVEDHRLVTSLEAADSASDVQKQAADLLHDLWGSMLDDFKMVFTPGSTADTLELSFEGTVKGQGSSSSQTFTLTRLPE